MSTARVVDQVRAARDARRPIRILGAGTWLDAGAPVNADETLSLAGDQGIVEYVPGDLTLTARAGTTLAQLEQATGANAQWLPLAPWGSPDATIGATMSTATAGPYAAAFGLPRDAALGLEFVTGTGDVVRAGGRVVKNVAGFDLTRLLTGSWGTLGVITEVTVRLRAMPQVSRTVVVEVNDTAPELDALASGVRRLPFAPFACELLNPALARRLGVGQRTMLLMQLGGNSAAVAAQLDAVRALGPATDADAGAIQRLRVADEGMASSWRLSARPTRFSGLWTAANTSEESLAHGSMARGVVRVLHPSAVLGPPPTGMSRVIERLPAEGWGAVGIPANALSERIRSKFDPDRLLNPGILGGVA